MQQRLVRSLYQEANISPEQVEYVEAHGTGTKVSECFLLFSHLFNAERLNLFTYAPWTFTFECLNTSVLTGWRPSGGQWHC